MHMNNYAMIVINTKRDDEDRLHIRRVLISYTEVGVASILNNKHYTYKNTRFIEADPYFKDSSKLHKYIFADTEYTLVSCPNKEERDLLQGVTRPYHSVEFPSMARAITFEAETDAEAIEKFNNRDELRD